MKLTDKHLHKLSLITGMPLEQIYKFDSMNLFSETRTLSLMIKYDWNLLRKNAKKYTSDQRIKALANEYNVSEVRVREAIYNKPKKMYYCYECGQLIGQVIFRRNKGLCDKCVIKSIKI